MAHTFALSVGHTNLGKEAWLRRMAESGICDFEYSNSPFPPVREVRAQIAGLRPYIEAGSIRFPSLHLPFGWNNEECPGQPEEFDRNLCMDRLGNLIDVFLPIGMKHLTMHVGRPVEGVSHEEGIPLSSLSDYRTELYRIYRQISTYGDETLLLRAVDNLTDFVGNTLNATISRIKRAFTDILGSEASRYLIQGEKGGRKTIHLERRLVVYEDRKAFE